MPKKKTPLPRVGDAGDRLGLTDLVYAHLDWMKVRGHTAATIAGREKAMRPFLRWCQERSLARAVDITRAVVESYQRHLFHHRKKNGEPLVLRSRRALLDAVRGFFRWCAKANLILFNPAGELELPRLPRRLPRFVLTACEVEDILRQPILTTLLGLRDRALLETLYSTAVRRSELARLEINAIDFERGTLMIREGKGRKDRVVPLGERAMKWLRRYLTDVRPAWVAGHDTGVLFLNHLGAPLDEGYLTHLVRGYVEKAAVGKAGSCHLFRHTVATLMLENGADIRFVQALLGHQKLETTAIYTHVSIGKLQEIHAATHPAERPRQHGLSEVRQGE